MKSLLGIIFLSFCILWFPNLFGQEKKAVSLSYCQEKAISSYPALSDRESFKDISKLRIKTIHSNYLPQLSVNGQATYQSDVVSIALPPESSLKIPSPAHDQYKLTIDAQQVLFDGGTTRRLRILEEASAAIDIQQIENDLLKVREMVNNTYFNIILLRENKKLLQNARNIIAEKEKAVKTMVKNGVLIIADENSLTAERLKIEQTIREVEINYNSSVQILNLLTDENFTDSTIFSLDEISISDSLSYIRPEYKTFELNEKRLEAAGAVTKTSLFPKIYAFGQLGYGRPGLNMLSNEFDEFYIVGATMKWNFWDWNKSTREKQVYAIQKHMISTKKDNFNKNLNIELQTKQGAIKKMEDAILKDSEIVKLRANITQIAQSQFDNGVITSTDFLNELNNETQARINYETHRILLIRAKANYLLATGNL